MRVFASVTIIVFALLFICTTFVYAEDENDDSQVKPEPAVEPEVVVTGKRVSEDPFSSDRSISVINNQKLHEVTPRTAPEALWDAPGAFVQETNYGGGSPIVRGLIGPQVLIMLDGVRLNNSTYRTGPVQYLNLIDPFSIDKIEVLRGPGSVLYGSDAMGGVIQIFPIGPRSFSDPDHFGGGGGIAGKFSSADYGRKGHAHADIGYGPFGMMAGGTYGESDNLIGGRDIGEQVHTGYENWSAIGRMNLNFAKWGITTGYLFNEIRDAGRTDKLFDSNSLQLYDNRDQLAYAKVMVQIDPIFTNLVLTGSYQHFFEGKDNFKLLDDLKTEESAKRDETTVGTIGVDLQASTKILDDRLRFVYGGLWYGDQVNAEGLSRSNPNADWKKRGDKPYPDGSTYDNYGAFLMIDGDPVSTTDGHILRLGAGYRFHGMRGFAPSENGLPKVDFDYQGNVFHGSLQYLYASQVNLALTYSQGFRSPNLQEAIQLGDTGKFFHIPNDQLEPETADTIEMAAKGRFWKMELGVAGYMTYLHDLINREPSTWEEQEEIDEKPVMVNVNGGEGRLWGIEPSLFLDIGWGLSFSTHATYTWGEEDRLDGKTKPLTRIPPLYGQAKLRWDSGNQGIISGFAEMYGRGAGKQDRLSPEDQSDNRIPEDGTPAWLTWNIRTGMQVYDFLRLGLAVENITNVDYKYHASGVSAAGTNAILTTELMF